MRNRGPRAPVPRSAFRVPRCPVLNVALTGNIAAGKSSVVDLFRRWGATIIDADVLVREAQAPARGTRRGGFRGWGSAGRRRRPAGRETPCGGWRAARGARRRGGLVGCERGDWRRGRGRRPRVGATPPGGGVRVKCTAWK